MGMEEEAFALDYKRCHGRAEGEVAGERWIGAPATAARFKGDKIHQLGRYTRGSRIRGEGSKPRKGRRSVKILNVKGVDEIGNKRGNEKFLGKAGKESRHRVWKNR